MVTSTSHKNVLRVSFLERDDKTAQVEIVCLVRAIEEGLEIQYVQHIYRNREITADPWQERRIRLPLVASMVSSIHSGVMHQLWSKFVTKIVPVDPELLSKEIEP